MSNHPIRQARVEYLGPSEGYKATITKHGPAYFLTKPEIQDVLQGLAVMAGPYDVTEYALDPGKPALPVEPRRIDVNVTCVQAHQLQAAAVIGRSRQLKSAAQSTKPVANGAGGLLTAKQMRSALSFKGRAEILTGVAHVVGNDVIIWEKSLP